MKAELDRTWELEMFHVSLFGPDSSQHSRLIWNQTGWESQLWPFINANLIFSAENQGDAENSCLAKLGGGGAPWPWLTGSSGGPRSVQGQLWGLQLDHQGFAVPSSLHSALKYFVFFTSL